MIFSKRFVISIIILGFLWSTYSIFSERWILNHISQDYENKYKGLDLSYELNSSNIQQEMETQVSTFNKANRNNEIIYFLIFSKKNTQTYFYKQENISSDVESYIKSQITRLRDRPTIFTLGNNYLLFLYQKYNTTLNGNFDVYIVFKDSSFRDNIFRKKNILFMALLLLTSLYIFFLFLYFLIHLLKKYWKLLSKMKKNLNEYDLQSKEIPIAGDLSNKDLTTIEKIKPLTNIEPIDLKILKQWEFVENTQNMQMGIIDDIRTNYQNLKLVLQNNILNNQIQNISKENDVIDISKWKELIIRLRDTIFYPQLVRIDFFKRVKEENILENLFYIQGDILVSHNAYKDIDKDIHLFFEEKIILGLLDQGKALKNKSYYIDKEKKYSYFPIVRNGFLEGAIRISPLEKDQFLWRNQITLTTVFLKTIFSNKK